MQGLDLEVDAIALFKLTVLETRKLDDAATIAATWLRVAEAYAKTTDILKRVTRDGLPLYEAFEITAAIPPQVAHVVQRLETLSDRAQELYELHT